MLSRIFSRPRNPEERRVRAWCRATLHITPGDLALYRQALRHSSAIPEDRPDLPNNERLEFLGDAILDSVIGDLLFRTYPDQGEGFLTRMRSKLVSRAQLNRLASTIGIEQVIESNVARGQGSSVPGNALEALIGAVFLDKGFERTRRVVVGLIMAHVALEEVAREDKDGKSRLLEWGQKRRRKVEFVVHEEGGGRGKHFRAEVLIDGQVRGSGRGQSKKVAEQDAAQDAFGSMRSRKPRGPRKTDPAPVSQEPPTDESRDRNPSRRSRRTRKSG